MVGRTLSLYPVCPMYIYGYLDVHTDLLPGYTNVPSE